MQKVCVCVCVCVKYNTMYIAGDILLQSCNIELILFCSVLFSPQPHSLKMMKKKRRRRRRKKKRKKRKKTMMMMMISHAQPHGTITHCNQLVLMFSLCSLVCGNYFIIDRN